MTDHESTTRLRSHANLPDGSEDIEGLGMKLRVWKQQARAVDIQGPLLDMLSCLQGINAAVRSGGPVQFSAPVSREIAYSVSCILADLAEAVGAAQARQDLQMCEQLTNALVSATHAWSQFLSGDIEDLLQDLRDTGLLK